MGGGAAGSEPRKAHGALADSKGLLRPLKDLRNPGAFIFTCQPVLRGLYLQQRSKRKSVFSSATAVFSKMLSDTGSVVSYGCVSNRLKTFILPAWPPEAFVFASTVIFFLPVFINCTNSILEPSKGNVTNNLLPYVNYKSAR